MSDPARDRFVAGHITSISTRAEPDTDQLILSLRECCWPGGSGDRSEPGALEWVRRWGPVRVVPVPPVCSCAIGRCRLCN
jgi:hypothetical protein